MTEEQVKRITELATDPIKGLPEFAKIVAEDAGTEDIAELMEKLSGMCQDYGWRASEVDAVRLIMAKAVLAASMLELMRKREEEREEPLPVEDVHKAHDMWMNLCAMGDINFFLQGLMLTILLVRATD